MSVDNREALIHVENLKKHYKDGEIRALDGVSTDIYRGDVVVVIGPSGSGKSTFLRSLNLLEVPTSGQITKDGVDITAPKADILRRSMQKLSIRRGFTESMTAA